MKGSSRKPPAARVYDNSLREEHAAQTRERILEAVARLIWEGKLEDFSVARAAEKSGVSAATIYRYFPNRTALLDGVNDWLGHQLARPPFPRTFADLVDGAPALFDYYERNGERLRMLRASEALRELREHGRRERDLALVKLLRPATSHLPAAEADAIHALIRVLHGFEAYEVMTERFGASAESASGAVRWAVRILAAELERQRGAKQQPKEKGRRALREGKR